MNDNQILDHISKIFTSVLEHSDFVLTHSSTAKDVDGWESATHIMIITEIEETFDIEFDLDELWEMKTIGDLIDSIKLKVK